MALSIVVDGHNFINDLDRNGKGKEYIQQLSCPILHDIIKERLNSVGCYSHPFIHKEFISFDHGRISTFKQTERNELIKKLKNEMGVTVREVPQHTSRNEKEKQKGVDFTVFIRMMMLSKSPA